MKFKVGDKVKFKKTTREVGFFDEDSSWSYGLNDKIGDILEEEHPLYLVEIRFPVGQCREKFNESELVLLKTNSWNQEII